MIKKSLFLLLLLGASICIAKPAFAQNDTEYDEYDEWDEFGEYETVAQDSTATVPIGCNDTCLTDSDCEDTGYVCLTAEDGLLRCRLSANPSSHFCALPFSQTSQPTPPQALLETGAHDVIIIFLAGTIFLIAGITVLSGVKHIFIDHEQS